MLCLLQLYIASAAVNAGPLGPGRAVGGAADTAARASALEKLKAVRLNIAL
jgi:hypothetical protein